MRLPSFTMVLLDRLRRNDKTYTELVFYENDFVRTDNFLDLVTAILTNTTVQTVRFHDCANPKWSNKQLKLLFSAIARLPKLRLLSVARTTVTLQSLAIVVDKGLQIKELDIWESKFVGTDQEVVQFAEALRQSQLTAMYLKRVTFGEIGCLDPLFAAFQESLDKLRLEEVHWKPGAVSDDVFRLLQSSRLTQLGIEHLPQLEECHYKAMAEGLKRSSLRDLTIVNLPISDETATAFSEALSVNENLKRLCLYKCNLSDMAAIELAKMLRLNTMLSSLELMENQIGDKGAIELSDALLSQSSTVKTFEIHGNNKIQEKGINAIVQLSEQSCVLETLKLFSLSRKSSTEQELDIQKKINSCMNLNARISGNASINPGKRPKVWYE
jgi:hypothetical protein